MPQFTLSFRIDPHPDRMASVSHEDKMGLEQEIRLALYKEFDLKVYSYAWVSGEQGWPHWQRLLKRMEALGKTREAVFGSGILYEQNTEEEQIQCPWFLLRSPNMLEMFSLMDPYPTCKAFQLPPGKHVMERHFVSETFKRVVENEGLTGLDFLWVRDKGKYRAPQWYAAIAQEPIGHGIDHPWFDRSAYETSIKVSPMYKTGMTHFDNRYFLSDWSTGDILLDEIIHMFPKDCLGLTLQSERMRFLKKQIPRTNFAYHWSDTDSRVDGRMVRYRELCLDRMAKDALCQAGVIKEANLVGIRLLDILPAGVSDLDAVECPSPVFAEKEWPELRKQEARFLAEHNQAEKPQRDPDIKRSLKLLRQAKAGSSYRIRKAVPAKKRTELVQRGGRFLPEFWLEVLAICDGGDWSSGETVAEMKPLVDLQKFQSECRHEVLQMDQDAPDDYFFLGHNDCGDLYALEIKQETQDCPVVLFSHETMDIEYRWEGIADFVESILFDL